VSRGIYQQGIFLEATDSSSNEYAWGSVIFGESVLGDTVTGIQCLWDPS